MINKVNTQNTRHSDMQALQKEALLTRVAADLVSIHGKFLSKADEVNKSVKDFAALKHTPGKKGDPGKDSRPEDVAKVLKDDREFTNKIKGEKGDAGETPDITKVAEYVTAMIKIPEVKSGKNGKTPKRGVDYFTEDDEQRIIKKVHDKIKDTKVDDQDYSSFVEKIRKLPDDKKLKTGDISGLEQTMQAFRHQLANGYLHGGGLSTVSHDVSLTGDGTPNNPLSVVGSSANLIDNEIVSGSGKSFTLANTPVLGSEHIYAEGARLYPGVGNDYTISGKNITTANSWTTGTILADYRN